MFRKSECFPICRFFYIISLRFTSTARLQQHDGAKNIRYHFLIRQLQHFTPAAPEYLNVILKEDKYYLLISFVLDEGRDLNSYVSHIFGLIDLTKETVKLLQVYNLRHHVNVKYTSSCNMLDRLGLT